MRLTGGVGIQTEVVVIGAGFAGLTAARDLAARGRDVLVLEGRDRVGGRSFTGEVGGVPVDLGATFVGPTQDAVLGLAAELGCSTIPTFCAGKNLIRWRGGVRSYSGTIPALSPAALVDIARVRWQFGRISRRLPIAQPWRMPAANRLDALSLQDWLVKVRASRTTRDLMAIMSRVTWGAEPDEVSMLHAARYVTAAGGLDRMLDVTGGAQQERFAAGTQQIALRMAEELGDRVRLGTAVRSIDYDPAGATVIWDDGSAGARAVILAIPPQHRAAITFLPELPPGPQQLPGLWPMGRLSKAYAVYPTPFWRSDGYSGEGLSDTGPVFITFDVSPHPDGPGILLGFADARHFDRLPAQQRRDRAVAGFTALFGDRAQNPDDYLDFCWGTEEFAPGGPTAAVPPGSWTSVGPVLRTPVGPLHWAGTEIADRWAGFLDGAVRSGHRAAVEVDAALVAR